MRRPKHRHHPDIWRERRRAENAWLTRRLKAPEPTEEELRRLVLRVCETAVGTATPKIAAMQALFDRIGDAWRD